MLPVRDWNNPYDVLGVPEPHPPQTPLTDAQIAQYASQRVQFIQQDASYQNNEMQKSQHRTAVNQAEAALRDATQREALDRRLRGNNPPNNSQTRPQQNQGIKDAQNRYEQAQKKKQELFYKGTNLKSREDMMSGLGGQGFENIQYLLIWLLLRNDNYSPLNCKIVYDENGKPKRGWDGGVKREMHFNAGAKLDDIFERTQGGYINPFKLKPGGLNNFVDNLNKMGLYGQEGFTPMDDAAYKMIGREGPKALNKFIKEYEKAGKVIVDRDNNGNPQGFKWKDADAAQQCMRRLQEHVDRYQELCAQNQNQNQNQNDRHGLGY